MTSRTRGLGPGNRLAAVKLGVAVKAFPARFRAPLTPQQYGDYVMNILTELTYANRTAFGLKGDTGITRLEPASAT